MKTVVTSIITTIATVVVLFLGSRMMHSYCTSGSCSKSECSKASCDKDGDHCAKFDKCHHGDKSCEDKSSCKGDESSSCHHQQCSADHKCTDGCSCESCSKDKNCGEACKGECSGKASCEKNVKCHKTETTDADGNIKVEVTKEIVKEK